MNQRFRVDLRGRISLGADRASLGLSRNGFQCVVAAQILGERTACDRHVGGTHFGRTEKFEVLLDTGFQDLDRPPAKRERVWGSTQTGVESCPTGWSESSLDTTCRMERESVQYVLSQFKQMPRWW